MEVPQKVIRLAKRLVPDIEAAPGAEEGSVKLNGDWTSAQAGYMLICRVNAPLIPKALAFIKDGKRAMVRGKDLGRGLRGMLKFLRGDTITEMLIHLRQYERNESTKIITLGERVDRKLAHLEDRVGCLAAILESCSAPHQAIERINQLKFTDE